MGIGEFNDVPVARVLPGCGVLGLTTESRELTKILGDPATTYRQTGSGVSAFSAFLM
jgi:hypothetical protein